VERHDDDGWDGEPARVIRDSLAVIAGGHRDDSAPPLIGIELQQTIERTALLERSRELAILELDVNLRSRELRKLQRVQTGGLCDPGRDSLRSRVDVSRADCGRSMCRSA